MAALTETSTWVATITGIDNGDPLDSTELTTPETQLTKRTKYLRDYSHATDTTQMSVPIPFMPSGTSSWFYDGTSYALCQETGSTNNFGMEVAPMHIPPGATITQVRMHVVGGQGGAHSGLPANMPSIGLYEVNPVTQGVVTVGSQTDTSASQPVYDAYHAVTLTVSQVVSATKRYVVRVRGESSTNALDNTLAVWGVDISWTAPASV